MVLWKFIQLLSVRKKREVLVYIHAKWLIILTIFCLHYAHAKTSGDLHQLLDFQPVSLHIVLNFSNKSGSKSVFHDILFCSSKEKNVLSVISAEPIWYPDPDFSFKTV